MSISIDLAGDVAVVTGGGSGIGEAIARTLARAGAAVAVADLAQESAQRVAKQIEADGGRALAVTLDIADRTSVEAGLAAVRPWPPTGRRVRSTSRWSPRLPRPRPVWSTQLPSAPCCNSGLRGGLPGGQGGQ